MKPTRLLVCAVGLCVACGGSGEGGQPASDAGIDASSGGNAGSGGSTGGAAGSPSGGTGGSTGGAAGLCATHCAKAATATNCPALPAPCESMCLGFSTGWCSAEWQAFLTCMQSAPATCALQPDSACTNEYNAAVSCNPGPVQLCIGYCTQAATAAGCTDSEPCYTACGANTLPTAPCSAAQLAVYQCATSSGTPQCNDILPGSSCSGAVAQLDACNGSGGGGGTGGTGGFGGFGGTGGNGGTGGAKTCTQLEQDYAAAMSSAKSCFGSASACNGMADKKLGCTNCLTPVKPSGESALSAIKLQFYQQNCDVGVSCGPCPTPVGTACLSNQCTEVY